uniref:Uncharacterized protein n=1 Tax=Pyxicephalus adspersus TaxID=30357 RepID=A0AAV3A9R7_PYXAD|nr:TPA: hypothetical protein GDO54_010395 [Pyxicephalus adspersus]
MHSTIIKNNLNPIPKLVFKDIKSPIDQRTDQFPFIQSTTKSVTLNIYAAVSHCADFPAVECPTDKGYLLSEFGAQIMHYNARK